MPEAPPAGKAAVQKLGIRAAKPLQEAGDASRLRSTGDQMEMIGHLAIGQEIDLVGIGMKSEQFEEERMIGSGEKRPLAGVAALRDM